MAPDAPARCLQDASAADRSEEVPPLTAANRSETTTKEPETPEELETKTLAGGDGDTAAVEPTETLYKWREEIHTGGDTEAIGPEDVSQRCSGMMDRERCALPESLRCAKLNVQNRKIQRGWT